MINENLVYQKIGMALVSAQRVEFVTGQLLEHLKEFDSQVYGITPIEFLDSKLHNNSKKTLGSIFKLLKLNSNLVISEELDRYSKHRNTLAHTFWQEFLFKKTEEQALKAIDFCNEFGIFSERMEKFFKGFVYFLALRIVKERDLIDNDLKDWETDFDYFMLALSKKRLL